MNGIVRLSCSLVMTLLFNAVSGSPVDCTAVVGAAEPPPLEERLDALVDELDRRRQELHVPGLAIAVVRGDEVILARGLGFADLDKQVPVTPETLFAIGSSTKAFTATLVGTLVDEGKMGWDDPVIDHLPFFDLEVDSDDEDAVVTIRDLLAHRTGFARMSVLFVGGDVTRDEVLRAAATAEPWAGFRQAFLYNNVMYLAAGVAAGNAAGSDWDTLMAERLLAPLKMKRSRIGIRSLEGDERLASGYDWDAARQVFTLHEGRDNMVIAPAGAIVSDVLDMAHWVRFQLGRGEFEGRRLLSEQQLRETWTPQIAIGGPRSYGLGWMLGEWEGQRVVEHGGNTRGYAAQVALLPESDLGFVLLANVTATQLQQLSMPMVWEAVLGAERTPPAASTDRVEPGASSGGSAEAPSIDDQAAYVGTYLPTHRRAEFTISEENGVLALTIPPNLRPFELKPPDEDGRRSFVATDQMAVSFERDAAGAVILMKVHQGPQDYECVRVGVELPAEIDLAELNRYLGSYRSEASGRTVTAFIQNNRLAFNVPGSAIFELRSPTDEGRWVFRIDAGAAVSFNEADDRIISVTFHQRGAPDVDLVRAEDGNPLPKLEEILDLRRTVERKAALDSLGVIRLSGTVRLPHNGIDGTVEWYAAGSDLLRRESDYGKFGTDRLTVSGGRAWLEGPGTPLKELHGKFLEQAQRAHPAALVGDWDDIYPSVRILRAAELDGRGVWIVELGGGATPDATAHVDAETGDILRLESAIIDPSSTLAIPVLMICEDYREVEGLRIPFRITTSTQITGEVVVEFDEVETHVDVDEGFFVRR